MKPLYDAILAYANKKITPFHMPGHKMGRGFVPQGLFEDPACFDLTEIPGTDDLYHPSGPIITAQEVAAEAFGAGRTWFLVNGASGGIHAMIAAFCKPNQKMIIGRDFHYAAYAAMVLAHVEPCYIYPEYDAACSRFRR